MSAFRFVVLTLLWISAGFADERGGAATVGQEPAVFHAKPLVVGQTDDELLRLLKERHNSALKKLQAEYAEMKLGRPISVDQLIEGAVRVVKSKLDLSDKHSERIAVLEDHASALRFLEKLHIAEHENHLVSAVALENSKYWRLDAEIELRRAKRESVK